MEVEIDGCFVETEVLLTCEIQSTVGGYHNGTGRIHTVRATGLRGYRVKGRNRVAFDGNFCFRLLLIIDFGSESKGNVSAASWVSFGNTFLA